MTLTHKLQELIDHISRQREDLVSSVSGLSEAQLNHSPDGSWSICDVLHHVAIVDEANAKLTSNMLKRARSDQPPPDNSPDGSELHSLDEVLAVMHVSKFQAPEFVTPKSHATVEESLTKLKASRARMLENLEQLDGLDLGGLTFPHPFAGPLNAYQWILIAGAHEARHAAQIGRMKASSGFPG